MIVVESTRKLLVKNQVQTSRRYYVSSLPCENGERFAKVIRVEGDSPDPLIIEDLSISSRGGRAISVEHVGSRTLVLKRSQFSHRGREGAGTVFMETSPAGTFILPRGRRSMRVS